MVYSNRTDYILLPETKAKVRNYFLWLLDIYLKFPSLEVITYIDYLPLLVFLDN